MRRFETDVARTARSVGQVWAEMLQMRAMVCQPGGRADKHQGMGRVRAR